MFIVKEIKQTKAGWQQLSDSHNVADFINSNFLKKYHTSYRLYEFCWRFNFRIFIIVKIIDKILILAWNESFCILD